MSSFADDANTLCDFSTVNHNSDTENINDTNTQLTQNTPASIHKENMHTETLLVIHTYNTMTLTIKILSHSETNIHHYYNKNYKTHTEFT